MTERKPDGRCSKPARRGRGTAELPNWARKKEQSGHGRRQWTSANGSETDGPAARLALKAFGPTRRRTGRPGAGGVGGKPLRGRTPLRVGQDARLLGHRNQRRRLASDSEAAAGPARRARATAGTTGAPGHWHWHCPARLSLPVPGWSSHGRTRTRRRPASSG